MILRVSGNRNLPQQWQHPTAAVLWHRAAVDHCILNKQNMQLPLCRPHPQNHIGGQTCCPNSESSTDGQLVYLAYTAARSYQLLLLCSSPWCAHRTKRSIHSKTVLTGKPSPPLQHNPVTKQAQLTCCLIVKSWFVASSHFVQLSRQHY